MEPHRDTEAALARIQAELVPWQQHNFPERPAWRCLVGAHEEFFEAKEARGNVEAYLDGVADHSIFLVDLCSALSISAPVAFKIGWDIADWRDDPWPRHLGKLTHHFLKLAQGIRGDPQYHRTAILTRIGCLFATLHREVEMLGEPYAETITKVWDEVKLRDWIAYPDTGRPPAPPADPNMAFAEAAQRPETRRGPPCCGWHEHVRAVCILPRGHDGDHAWSFGHAAAHDPGDDQ
jgi:hypothetical protein